MCCCSQEMALSVVVSVLNSTKSTDIPALVASLSPVDQVRSLPLLHPDRSSPSLVRAQVTLMKYLYKAMENIGDASGNVVLGWHEKVPSVSLGMARENQLTWGCWDSWWSMLGQDVSCA